VLHHIARRLESCSSAAAAAAAAGAVAVAGLGRVVLSNIRTPKMLMDVGGGGGKDASADDQDQQQEQASSEASKARPLEQEPMLAARIMVEDCMLLLCDVEDIDRMFAATTAAGSAHAAGAQLGPHTPGPISPALAQGLLQRRAALLGGIAASFRLPDAPTLAPAAAGDAAAGAAGDRVFVRILALPKGRSLITKTLKLMFTPPPAVSSKGAAAAAAASVNGSKGDGSSSAAGMGLDVIWALLRNAQLAFGPPLVGSVGEAEKRLTDATIALSVIASEMVKRLKKPEEAVACLAAAIVGLSAPTTAGHDAANSNGNTSACQLLPLYPAGRVPAGTSPEWLGSILGSLLLRASELGLGSFAAAAAAVPLKSLGDGGPEAADLQEAQTDATGVLVAVSAEWQSLLGQFVQLVQLHLWQLVQAVRGAADEVAAAAAAGPGSSEVLLASVSNMACVPLMRVLMAHCSEEQQEQLKGYLSEVGR
jgi:DNA topoisomerase 2-associated protein PAT1